MVRRFDCEGVFMRTNKILNYESILQVLDETGCPFCRFLKNFQASLLQDPKEKDIHRLCNFHTWGLAASQRAATAADLFLHLLDRYFHTPPTSSCDICVLLQLEEDRRIREFIGCANHKLVSQWIRTPAALCFVHGTKLKDSASPLFASTINSIMENYRQRLIEEITSLRDEYQPNAARWGVLGHAAEFLVSQRGLHT
jgi:hypothetical protein